MRFWSANGASRNGGIGAAAKQVAEHASSIARLEVQLALVELKRKAVALGVGIGLLVGAALFALFALVFALAAVGAAFATFLPVWAALLVVMGILLLVTAVCAGLGMRQFKKGSPPMPNEAIEEAKLTTEAIRR